MLTSVVLVASLLLGVEQPADCPDVTACRRAALAAAEQQNFEAFHDLAWRAVQKGPRNDPELMWLLARAQSLSGRPGDALVMLRRLAASGIAAEALTSDDFRRVRDLPAWPEVAAAILAAGKGPTAAEAPSPTAVVAPRPEARTPVERPAESAPAARRDPPAAVAKPPVSPTPSPPALGEEAFRLPAATFDPIGLAYDDVSRRVVMGDRRLNKLIVADEVFKRINDFVGAGAGGFGTLTALEIDRRRGDLWVASTAHDGAASVHKLQLVSGRVLAQIEVPEEWLPASLTDIAMTDAGTLLLVDREGARLLTMASARNALGRAIPLALSAPRSIAAAGTRVYVAHAEGLAAVDVNSGKLSEVQAGKGVTLAGLQRIRWHRGSLIGIQEGEEGETRLVRIRLGRSGTLASRLEALDDQPAEQGSALTLAGDVAYYVAVTGEGPTIRRVALK